MRKVKTVIISGVVVLVAAATIGIHQVQQAHNRSVVLRDASTSAAHQKALADWEMKVQKWNADKARQAQVTQATDQSDLQQQGVDTLPNTGPGSVFVVFVVASALGSAGHFFLSSNRAKRVHA